MHKYSYCLNPKANCQPWHFENFALIYQRWRNYGENYMGFLAEKSKGWRGEGGRMRGQRVKVRRISFIWFDLLSICCCYFPLFPHFYALACCASCGQPKTSQDTNQGARPATPTKFSNGNWRRNGRRGLQIAHTPREPAVYNNNNNKIQIEEIIAFIEKPRICIFNRSVWQYYRQLIFNRNLCRH